MAGHRLAKLDAIESPSPELIAWAAGIFEGEGTCTQPSYSPQGSTLRVVQKDPWILYRLRDLFGGSVAPITNRVAMYAWWICGGRAKEFVGLVHPYLSPRRQRQVQSGVLRISVVTEE